jgi:uncharacterized protein involved in outer membrane biogenesis
MGDGPLSLTAHLARIQDRWAVRDFDLAVARVHTHGTLAVDFAEVEPLVSGQVIVDELALPLPNNTSNLPLSLDFPRRWRGDLHIGLGRLTLGAVPVMSDVSGSLSIAGGRLRIAPVTGQLGAGRFVAELTCDTAASPPAMSLQASLADVDLATSGDRAAPAVVSGRADANVELAANGFSPSALLATLRGQLAAVVKDGSVAGFDLSRLKRAIEPQNAETAAGVARQALTSGVTPFGELKLVAHVAHGEVSIEQARLAGADGEAQATGGLQIADGLLDVRIDLRPNAQDTPDFSLHLTGPIGHPNRLPELTSLARWIADHAR